MFKILSALLILSLAACDTLVPYKVEGNGFTYVGGEKSQVAEKEFPNGKFKIQAGVFRANFGLWVSLKIENDGTESLKLEPAKVTLTEGDHSIPFKEVGELVNERTFELSQIGPSTDIKPGTTRSFKFEFAGGIGALDHHEPEMKFKLMGLSSKGAVVPIEVTFKAVK